MCRMGGDTRRIVNVEEHFVGKREKYDGKLCKVPILQKQAGIFEIYNAFPRRICYNGGVKNANREGLA